MKIIPQNGMILIKFIGRGEKTTETGVIMPDSSKPPSQMEVVSCRVLALDTEYKDEKEQTINLIAGQVVLVQMHAVRLLEDDAENKNRGFVRWVDIIAVIEETEDAN